MSRSSADAFMEKLLDPLPEAKLHDPEMKRLQDKAQRADRQARKQAWRIGMIRCRIAEHQFSALDYKRLLVCYVTGPFSTHQCPATHAARMARQAVWDKQMLLPVAAPQDLKWKREHLLAERNIWGCGPNNTPAVMRALEADEAWLAQRKKREGIMRPDPRLIG